MLFIFNPHTAGGKLKTRLMEILCRFSAAGYELSVWPTTGTGHARAIAKEHGAGCDIVVCCGGDGTLNEVVDGLMGLERVPRLGYIPGGTTNDFASSLKLPKSNILAAADRVLAPKKVHKLDVGRINDRSFVYVAAFGAFTDVSYKTPQGVKNVLGYFAYLLEAVQHFGDIKPTRARFVCDEEEYRDEYLLGMITNSTSVAGFPFPNKDKIRLDDGMFEAILVKHPHRLAELGELSAALMRGNFHSDLLTVLRVRQMEFSAGQPVAWTLDGEYGGKLENAKIEVRHRALEICV